LPLSFSSVPLRWPRVASIRRPRAGRFVGVGVAIPENAVIEVDPQSAGILRCLDLDDGYAVVPHPCVQSDCFAVALVFDGRRIFVVVRSGADGGLIVHHSLSPTCSDAAAIAASLVTCAFISVFSPYCWTHNLHWYPGSPFSS